MLQPPQPLCVSSWWMQWTHWTGMFWTKCTFSWWSCGAARVTNSVTRAHATWTWVSHAHTSAMVRSFRATGLYTQAQACVHTPTHTHANTYKCSLDDIQTALSIPHSSASRLRTDLRATRVPHLHHPHPHPTPALPCFLSSLFSCKQTLSSKLAELLCCWNTTSHFYATRLNKAVRVKGLQEHLMCFRL